MLTYLLLLLTRGRPGWYMLTYLLLHLTRGCPAAEDVPLQRMSRQVDGDLPASLSKQRISRLVDVDLLDYPFGKERLADVHF